MSEYTTEAKNTVQPWLVSLGISVFCCAVFFVIISNYIGQLTDTLDRMEARLAVMETRAGEPTPTVAPINVVIPQPATISPPTTSNVPPVDAPTFAAPGSTGSGVPGMVPSAAPAPEAVAPVMPAVPSSPEPIPAEVPATH